MLSAKFLAILALFATSTSAIAVGNHQPMRRHSHRAAVGARTAPVQPVAKRDVLPAPRKRGINARRCAPRSPPALSDSSTPSPTSSDPEPTQSQPAPEPTTTSAQPTTTKSNSPPRPQPTKTSTTPKPSPTDNGGSSSGGSDKFTGDATFYGTGLGACGITNKDSDYIAAVSHLLFDGFNGYTGGDPNKNPICNKRVTAHYQGKSVSVIITDRCVGCAYGDLDFSPAAFDQLADESLGRLKGMTWSFN